jgi:hypothetical protein
VFLLLGVMLMSLGMSTTPIGWQATVGAAFLGVFGAMVFDEDRR